MLPQLTLAIPVVPSGPGPPPNGPIGGRGSPCDTTPLPQTPTPTVVGSGEVSID